jgi:hypothetical protein
VVVIIKSRYTLAIYELPETNKHIFIWAVGGSESDIRNYKIELYRFLASFSIIFSERDVNLKVIQDFTASYLRQRFYNTRSAEPTVLELILGSITNSCMIFCTINYEGSSEPLDQSTANIAVIGSGDDNAKRELAGLVDLKTKNLTAQKAIKKIQKILNPYTGNFYGVGFTIKDIEQKARPKRAKKRKDQKRR